MNNKTAGLRLLLAAKDALAFLDGVDAVGTMDGVWKTFVEISRTLDSAIKEFEKDEATISELHFDGEGLRASFITGMAPIFAE